MLRDAKGACRCTPRSPWLRSTLVIQTSRFHASRAHLVAEIAGRIGTTTLTDDYARVIVELTAIEAASPRARTLRRFGQLNVSTEIATATADSVTSLNS